MSDFVRLLAPGASWLFGDRVVRSGLELGIGLWIARHLGPDAFGDLSLALVLAALVGPLTRMGLQGLLVREVVTHPQDIIRTMGSAAFLRIIGSLIGGTLLFMGALLLAAAEPGRAVLIQIISAAVCLQWLEVMDLYLQAKDRMAASSIARSGSAIVASLVRVGLIMGGAGVISFAWVVVGETLVWGVMAVWMVRSSGERVTSWRPDRAKSKSLLSESWLLVLSGFGGMLNLKIDQVMLGGMATGEELGLYAAAARLSEGLYFLPAILATAAFPAILRARSEDAAEYRRRLRTLFDILAVVALFTVAGGLLVGPFVLSTLLGDAFGRSTDIFRIHVLAIVFVFPGVLLSRWLIAEGRMRLSLVRHVAGSIVNVALNLALIPVLGGVGAAITTVISYATSAYIICFFTPATRPLAGMMTRAVVRIPATAFQMVAALRPATRPRE